MISNFFQLFIVLIFYPPEKVQIPEIYDFYVYEKTFIDPVEGPSKLINGDPTQTITLLLRKDLSFIFTDRHTTLFSAYTTKMTGSWYLTSSDVLQLNILSKENIFSLEGLDEAHKELTVSPDTLQLDFLQSVLIYDSDKELIPRGKLIKFNKKHMKKIYGENKSHKDLIE